MGSWHRDFFSQWQGQLPVQLARGHTALSPSPIPCPLSPLQARCLMTDLSKRVERVLPVLACKCSCCAPQKRWVVMPPGPGGEQNAEEPPARESILQPSTATT